VGYWARDPHRGLYMVNHLLGYPPTHFRKNKNFFCNILYIWPEQFPKAKLIQENEEQDCKGYNEKMHTGN
jgi:hypothetical protein